MYGGGVFPVECQLGKAENAPVVTDAGKNYQ